MKRFSLLLLLISPFYGQAQEKIPFADGQEIIVEASEAADFEKGLELITRIHPKDSLYYNSLVPKSYYLLNLGKSQEAIAVANEGLAADTGILKLSFHINKAVSYLNSDEPEQAFSAVSEGLNSYPRSFQLWYNKGLILEKLDRIKEAVAAYQQAVLLNPAYAPPHLRLGNICYKQELTAQAMMAFNMYLILNPDGAGAFDVLRDFNDLVRIKNPNTGGAKLEITGFDEDMEELNLLLDNRLALNEQYEVNSKLTIPLTKQNHLLLSQLATYEGDAGFWGQVYLPIFKWVWNNDRFADFTNVVSFSIENEDYKKLVRKDIEGLKNFRSSLLTQWQNILQPPAFRVLEEDKNLYFKYADLRLDGIGEAEGETLKGPWKFYNGDGLLAGEGEFDAAGKRTGSWKWYDDNDNIKETATYKNGVLEGKNQNFFRNGRLKFVAHYENDELNGEHILYNNRGALIERKFFRDGVLEGNYRSNFPVGEILKEFDIVYKKGLVEGKAYEYYANGKVYSEMNFVGGEKNGIEKNYNRDGSLSSELNFVANKAEGPFITYFLNGNVSERSFYKNGLLDGPHELFYEDGTLKTSGNIKEGLYQGVFKNFDKDGKLHNEYDYKNGEIIAYRFYNKEGELYSSGKRKGGEFYYRAYAPHGAVTAEGLYDVSGGRKGHWKFYSAKGILTGEGEYSEDKANGLYTEYYPTGKKLAEATYNMDTLHGYYRSFFPEGQMKSQGWYVDGEEHGEWRHYYQDGKLQAKNFFHKGDLHNLQEFYGVDGKLTSTLFYDFGEVLEENFYDPEEQLFEKVDRNREGKYLITLHHFNGLVSHETEYVNGIKHGKYTQYDYNGKKLEEGQYVNGEQSGTWKSYHPNGKIKSIVNLSRGELHGEMLGYFEDGQQELSHDYVFGSSIGVSKYYHENGEVSVRTPYLAGEEHGRKEFFDPSGKLELVRFYEHGRLLGYSYLDENSSEIPMIPLPDESGTIKAYFDNGKLSREMEYLKGNTTGVYRSYYYSGVLKYESGYRSGEYHGTVKEYYPNGELQSEKTYHLGELHGPSRTYFENGRVKEEINYVYDMKHGKSVTFNEQGVQIKQEQYINGNIYEAEKI